MDEEFESQTEPKKQDLQKIIPIAIGAIIVIGIILVGLGFVDINSITGQDSRTRVLVIGESSQEVLGVLNDNRETINYDIRTVASLERNPTEQITGYKIIILDQSQEATKEITKDLGDAFQAAVAKGTNLVVVLDSGIKRPDTTDVVGWESTFGEIVPVKCDRTLNNQLTCTNKILVNGKLMKKEENHKIMEGIDMFPLGEGLNTTFGVFDIQISGNEIAYIKSSGVEGKSYVGIAEKRSGLGKVIYFNYNPGKTRGIFENTLDYLS